VERPVFEVSMKEQAPAASLSLDEMLAGGRTWEVL
jgi:hypothetical protein